ncbi:hypothetical protein CBER1_08717 [Cercospora berteroae]|uniref:Carrier domain-containing protein n=1 Tax=Cercospora berteroae TaxID=357750 RepID=A0A2S6CAC4_9PEZI|nr:hypothetical protein CBER1_08717 [Cercospora berteroae]
MDPKPVNVGIIGCGEAAQVIHIPLLNQLYGKFTITYLCSSSADALSFCSQRVLNHVPRCTSDPKVLCASSEVDVVFVLSSDEQHPKDVMLGLAHDKHVFVEKPLALSVLDTNAIIQAEKKSKGRVFVGYMRRYAAGFAEIQEEIAKLGPVKYARVRDIIGPNELFVEQSSAFPRRFHDYPPEETEKRALMLREVMHQALEVECKVVASPDQIIQYQNLAGLGSHDLSAMREILGEPIAVTGASLGNEFWNVLFEFPGFTVSYESGFLHVPVFDAHIEIYRADKILRRHVRKTYEDPFVFELKELYIMITEDKAPKTSTQDAAKDIEVWQMIIRAAAKDRSFQVKVNGQKVELGDIESKLARHPDVSHCAVLYPVKGPYAKRLVAITQAKRATAPASRHARAANKSTSALTLQVVTEYLQDLVPSFMLPSVLIGIETMPFTPTMKIDRTRLKKCLSEDDILVGSLERVTHVSTALSGTRLLPTEKSAMKVSDLIADVVAAPRSTIWKSISGHDNRLTDIGIDSAQTMRLAALIRKQFGHEILFEALSQPGMTVRKLAALLESDKQGLEAGMARCDVHNKVDSLKERVALHTKAVLSAGRGQKTCSRHVFLTGGTGYFGVQILSKLLLSSNIASVTVLVRSSSRVQALERVRAALVAAQAESSRRTELHAWPGDLSKPRLGLFDADWMRLSRGHNSADADGPRIDTIIHCGAVVNWTQSYSDLKAPNVNSTEELLKLVGARSQLRRFVFVSGGRYPSPAQDVEEDLEALYTDAAEDNGYAQSKFVAERLVHNARSALLDKSISVVCPAYLIGGRQHGLANQDDYLWRVVWATLRIGAFNADERDQWLFVAQSDAVAERIVALTLLDFKSSSSTTLNVLDGLSVGKFWSIVSEALAIPLIEVTGDVWLQKVKLDMDKTSDHLLWPLASSLESGRGLLTRQRCCTRDTGAETDPKDIEMAVRANMEHLHKAGFFTGMKPE